MTTIRSFMTDDHRHCDDLFAEAEQAIAQKNTPAALAALVSLGGCTALVVDEHQRAWDDLALQQASGKPPELPGLLDRELAADVALCAMKGRDDPVSALSTREFEVFLQLARGRAVAQIAELLCVSPSTIGTHLYHVKQKLGAGNAAELAMIAMRAGLIEA